ncbi:MAG: protein kinase domain-containing protein [Solirubrobacteraceae bacterium]
MLLHFGAFSRNNEYVQVGPYLVDGEHPKEGGQAFVYFGADGGKRIAVKVARPSNWSRQRLKREIAVQTRLDHPNVLKIIRHDAEGGWYAMRRALGSLEDLGPFPKSEWTRLRVGLFAVSQAVSHAHELSFVHRDLSPANILIFPDRWVVADWGFVCEPFQPGLRMTQPLERFGTPEFMAPELLLDPRDAKASADVFSIGRIAAWGTGFLQDPDEARDNDQLTGWWLKLIDGAAAYEPKLRWTMRDVITHLRAQPKVVSGATLKDPTGRCDVCPRCGSGLGRDGAERCLSCHWLSD